MTDLNEKDVKSNFVIRLQRLATAWSKKFEPTLKHRQKLLRLWASGFYDGGYVNEHLINLMDRGVSTVVPFLVEGNPRVLVETLMANLRPYSYSTQLVLNFLINKMNLAENVFIPIATNSMFGAGITRMIFDYDRLISLDNEVIKLGTPYICVIDDSAYIGDPSAKRRIDFSFEGDTYRLPTEYAKDLFAGHDKFGKQIADFIQPDGELVLKYSPEEIASKDFDYNKLALREFTTFQDIYLKDENTIITILPEGGHAKKLREVEWEGPGDGPYDYLAYKYFPESPVPIPPAWTWHDLDVSMNILAMKAREQAESQKDVIVAEPGTEEAANKLLNAKNMDIIVTADADSVDVKSLGGVNPVNYQWMAFAENQFTKSGTPSSDIIAGRGAQAPTLGQEQMVFQNATRIINNMYTRFQNFMTSVIEKLAWGVWTDRTAYYPFVEVIPGAGEVPVIFSDADKAGDFYDFVFKITPYSSQRMSPEVKYSRMMQFLTSWILPTMQMAQAQGAQLDIPTATKILSDYVGIENLQQFYKTAVPEPPNDKLPYWIQPKGTGQMNDKFGSSPESRESNKNQQQRREGIVVKPVPGEK